MPSIIHNLVLVIHILLAIGLVCIIVLMQRSEGGMGGLGGGGSGGMGGFLAGRTQANMITRTTGILAAAFFLTSLLLGYGDHRMGNAGPLVPASTTAPAVPGNAPAAQAPATVPVAPSNDSGTTTQPESPATPAAPAQPAAPSGQ